MMRFLRIATVNFSMPNGKSFLMMTSWKHINMGSLSVVVISLNGGSTREYSHILQTIQRGEFFLIHFLIHNTET